MNGPPSGDAASEIERPLILERLSVRADGKVLLKDAAAEMPAGKITVVVGGSGAGKSVLLRILSGLIPRRGEVITWEGEIGHGQGRPLGRVGIVFQQFALFDEWSPTANVQFAIDHRRRRRLPPDQSAECWLRELRVPTDVPVAALSGGQKQRLAIARTLAADPDLVLYDEPTSGLDAASGRQVAQRIRRTQTAHRRTSIVVTHDYETLLPIADCVYLLDSDRKQLIRLPRQQWSQIAERMKPVRRDEADDAATDGSATAATDGSVTIDDGSGEATEAGPAGSSGVTASPATKDSATATRPRPSSARRPRLLSARAAGRAVRDFFSVTGTALTATLRLPLDLLPRWPRLRWGGRFLLHYLRLVCGPSAWVYLIIAGMIVGFTTTYFTFKFLPYTLYTKPLLLEDLLMAIGFALYRVLVPILATTLVAARCGAAVAADVGVKKYGSQIEALQTLGIQPRVYLLTPILLAFIVGTPLLQWLAYQAARIVSLLSFTATHPEVGPHFWALHFESELVGDGWFFRGASWLFLKVIASGVGVAAIAYYRGARPKQSASDVSHAITSTVLWATLYVLVVHFVVAFYEF